MTLVLVPVLLAAFSVVKSVAWLPPGLRGGIPPWGPAAPPVPPPWLAAPQSVVFRRPMDAMVDLTNDLGVAILQDYSHARSNFAFSPYGLASVLVVLYEGAHGESARQIHLAAKFPWDRDITRIGFRDIHRHLRSYFSHEGYLSGITLNKAGSSLQPEYKKVLRFYGYDVDIDSPKPTKPTKPNGEKPMVEVPVVKPPEPKPATSPPGGNTFQWTTRSPTTIGSEVTLNLSASLAPKETDAGVTEHSVLVITNTQTTKLSEPVTTKTPVSESGETTNVVLSEKSTEVPVLYTEGTGPEKDSQTTVMDETSSPSTIILDNGMLIPGAPILTTSPEAIQGTKEDSAGATQGTTIESVTIVSQQPNTVVTVGQPISSQTDSDEAFSSAEKTTIKNSVVTTLSGQAGLQTDILTQSTLVGSITSSEMATEETISSVTVAEEPESTTLRLSTINSFDIDIRVQENNSIENIPNSVTTVRNIDSREKDLNGNGDKTDEIEAEGKDGGIVLSSEISDATLPEKESTTVNNEELKTETFSTRLDDTSVTGDIQEDLFQTTENTFSETAADDVKNSEDNAEFFSLVDFTTMPTQATVATTEINLPIYGESTTLESKDDNETVTDKNLVKRSPFPVLIEPIPPWKIKTLEEYLLFSDIGKKPLQETERVQYSGPHYLEPNTLDEYLIQKNIDWSTVENGEEVLYDERFVPKTLEEYLFLRDAKHLRNSAPILSFQTEMDFTRSRLHRHPRTISDILHIPAVPDLSLQLQNGMFDSHVSRKAELYRPLPRHPFLVDSSVETAVPVMTYSNIFPFAYIPRLHSQALEFPLDDERYKLLIILPMERRGLRQLIYDLSAVTLRGVMDSLRPSRVKATVPTFMVEGFVILTPALQRLGIWNVFDPRKANLSSMSSDPELYVRNVEQSVTVVIRNYVEILDIQTRTMAARGVEHEFIATHPFLYFVLDTETNVSLMAGQMLDPLNSRIY